MPDALSQPNASRASRLFCRVAGFCLACGLAWTPVVQSALAAGSSATGSAGPVTAASKPAAVDRGGPHWADLTPVQKSSLQPLNGHWDNLNEASKRKWLAISRNYPGLSASEQAKMQSRMTEWVNLSAQQRTQARVNFAQAKAIPPSERQSKWEQYQALSPDEKRRLAAKASSPTKGVAPAIKPVTPQQITVVAKHKSPIPHSAASAPNQATGIGTATGTLAGATGQGSEGTAP